MSSILVLDDRPADRMLLVNLLSHAGHEVCEAATGMEALEAARARKPDLVITDIVMPSMNGYEFVRELRSDPAISSTQVVFCTANYLEGEVRRLSEACGVSDFISKPSEPQEIMATVDAVLGARTRRPHELAAPVFDREQTRLLNDKLVEKVLELEAANEERQKLVVQLLQAQEQERRALAEALHDDSIQTVSAAVLQLEMAARDSVDEGLSKAIRRIRDSLIDTGDGLRSLLFELQPVELERQGLALALEAYLEKVRDEDGLAFELTDRMTCPPVGRTRRLLYRNAREAVMNVRKHAWASKVEVILDEHDDQFVVRVRDDGIGFSPEEAMHVRPGHLGLPSMREGLDSVGGSLEISSTVGAGSMIEIAVPHLDAEKEV
jgi:signal transduction histidine kinase